jgi:hypothetical protein
MRRLPTVLRMLAGFPTPDDRINDALCELHSALKDAESSGDQFGPSARLARTALRAICWR